MEDPMRNPVRVLVVLALSAAGAALAAPVTYEIDTKHTSPSFEADHFGGVSVWRGKFTGTTGKVVLDRAAQTGTVDIEIDTSTAQTGVADLDKHLKGDDFFAVDKFPKATYKGKLVKFKDGAPTEVQGDLTIRGVTKPVTLTIRSFKCISHPMKKDTELCGADAHGTINREDFGVAFGKNFGFDMKTTLAIQVEGTAPK
jgi:polyisoprenoid-binding protein YceI